MKSSLSRRQILSHAALGCAALSIPSTGFAQSNAIKTYDMRPFVKWIIDEFEPSVRLPGGAGRYARKAGDANFELYGTSDMACVLYTLSKLRPNEKERAEWLEAFQSFQNPETGMLVEKASPTHDPRHNTAFALAAMQLLDLRPKYPVKVDEYADPKAFLATLNWKTAVYTDSHKGAGVGSIYQLAGLGDAKWFNDYFAACDSYFDPNNGMMGQGKPPAGDFDQIGGTFHYEFLYEFFNRRMPYPEKRIDAIIGLQRPDGHWDVTNRTWLTMDAIYMLTRAVRQCHHRIDDVNKTIMRALDSMMTEVYSPEGRTRVLAGRLPVHTMTCAVSTLAEAQMHFGIDKIVTEWPLKMILDRRPFI